MFSLSVGLSFWLWGFGSEGVGNTPKISAQGK